MFGGAKKWLVDEQGSRRARLEEERLEYWKLRIDGVKDPHETTRVYLEYRQDQLLEWLKEFDQRVASEIRQQTRTITRAVWLATGMVALLVWFR